MIEPILQILIFLFPIYFTYMVSNVYTQPDEVLEKLGNLWSQPMTKTDKVFLFGCAKCASFWVALVWFNILAFTCGFENTHDSIAANIIHWSFVSFAYAFFCSAMCWWMEKKLR